MKKIYFILVFMAAYNISYSQCTNTGTALSASITVANINCTTNDGGITINAIDGWTDILAPNGTGYSYTITAGPITRPTQSSNIFASLPTGNYTISITDCNGSIITRFANIAGTLPAAITTAPILFRSICANNNGVKLGPSGGRPPYTIAVTSSPAGSTPVIKGDTVFGLAAGTLSVTITDACGTSLGAGISIATHFPITASASMYSIVAYGGCNGIVGDLYYGRNTPYIRYALTLTGTNFSKEPSLVVDSFYTELFFNNVYQETVSPTTGEQLVGGSIGLIFNGYGPGRYTLKTYARCAGLIKTDSLVFGNRPASPTGTNTNLNDNANVGYPRLDCTNFDITISANNAYGGVFPLGHNFDIINPRFKIRILSGASSVGDSAWSTSNYVYFARLNNLSYSATPYSIEVSDTCGNKDTVFFTRTAPLLTKTPTANAPCDAYNSNLNYVSPHTLISGPSGLPKIYPIRATFLSGTAIDYTTYPFTIIDSVGLLVPNVPRIPTRYPGTSVRIAYENGCGDRDTTLWSINCTFDTAGKVSYIKTPLCGSRANLTFNQTRTGQPSGLVVFAVQWPTGSAMAYPNIALNRDIATSTHLNIIAGTYRFRGVLANNATWNFPFGSKTTDDNFYISGIGTVTVGQTANYGYPLTGSNTATSFQTLYRSSVSWSSGIDTARLRMWDTTFTVIIDSTNLKVTATESYLCKDGTTSANIMAKAANKIANPGFQYSYSIVSSTGPWSSPSNDSLIVVPGISPNTPVWVRVTDACGSSVVTNTTVGVLSSSMTSSCNGADLATINPNPYTSSFRYGLRNPSNALTNYNFGDPITIDLSIPANAGNYNLYFRLRSSTTIGCIADSLALIATSPCLVVLPINLIKFSGRLFSGIANISWQASENEINSYNVQRSYDGISWITVKNVSAVGNGLNQYLVKDAAGNNESVFYRLKINERNGESSFSSILFLRQVSNNDFNINVYPNPTQHKVNIELGGEVNNVSLGIMDVLGKISYTGKSLQSGINTIDLADFQPGVYWLIINNDGVISHQQIIIEN